MINKKTNDNYVLYNLKPKIRTNYLYAMANAYRGVVVSNLNYDEYILGFFTKHGDSAADYHMLIGLLKKHIYELGAYYSLPTKILNRAPTPSNEDDEHQTDESFLVLHTLILINFYYIVKLILQLLIWLKNAMKLMLINILFLIRKNYFWIIN